MANWPVAILAGGLATRLRPATDKIPKALLSVAGEPFLVHQLRLLHSEGFRKIVLCVGYLGEMIEAKIGDGKRLGLQIDYSFDGPTLLGTGGALKRATSEARRAISGNLRRLIHAGRLRRDRGRFRSERETGFDDSVRK